MPIVPGAQHAARRGATGGRTKWARYGAEVMVERSPGTHSNCEQFAAAVVGSLALERRKLHVAQGRKEVRRSISVMGRPCNARTRQRGSSRN